MQRSDGFFLLSGFLSPSKLGTTDGVGGGRGSETSVGNMPYLAGGSPACRGRVSMR